MSSLPDNSPAEEQCKNTSPQLQSGIIEVVPDSELTNNPFFLPRQNKETTKPQIVFDGSTN